VHCCRTGGCVTEYSVCGSCAWARAQLSDVTPECAIYTSSPTSLFRESEQLQNLLSESLYLLRDTILANKFQLTPKYCQQSPVISLLPIKASEINLFKISAVIYKLLSKKKNHKTFIVSLNKLDSLLTDY
jgi:hypothetical protein